MTAAAALTPASPLVARLWAYTQERFPLGSYALLIASYVSANAFLAQALTNPGAPVRHTPDTLLAAVTVLAAFFHLRVFDEHKDYADDCRHHPGRVLQRGLVTLRHLRLLGGGAIVLELGLAAWHSPAALAAVALALGYALLMAREFFVRDWLRRHFLVYATSHLLIMPLFALICFSFATGRWPWEAPAWFWVYGFVGYFVTFNWEVSRKIRAPEDEVAGVETYTSRLGTYRAAWLVLGLRVVDTALVALVGWHLGLTPAFHVAIVLLFGVCAVGFVRFRRTPTPRTAKAMETWAGVYIVAFDLILAACLAQRFGLRWGRA